jgi:hypothetical protein
MRLRVHRSHIILLAGWTFFLSAARGTEGALSAADDGPVIAQSQEYFPDQQGNRWQYRGQVAEGPLQTIENKFFVNESSVTGSRSLKGVSVTVFHDTNAGNHGPSDSFYRRDAAGIVYHGSAPGTPLEQQLVPYQIIRFPMKLGASFQQFDRKNADFGTDLDGDGVNERVDAAGTVSVLGREAVTVPAGTYQDAVKVEARMTLRIYLSRGQRTAQGVDVMTAWFVRGVGLAKYIERQELPPLRTERGIVTEIIEELEAFDVKPASASLSRSEPPSKGIFADDAGHHELRQVVFSAGLRAHP